MQRQSPAKGGYREQLLYASPHRKGVASRAAGCSGLWRTLCRLPRTGCLCKLLVVLVAAMVLFHAASCGFFFCVRFPGAVEFPRDIYEDIRDIYVLAGLCLLRCVILAAVLGSVHAAPHWTHEPAFL